MILEVLEKAEKKGFALVMPQTREKTKTLSDAWRDVDCYLLATDCVFDVFLLLIITYSN